MPATPLSSPRHTVSPLVLERTPSTRASFSSKRTERAPVQFATSSFFPETAADTSSLCSSTFSLSDGSSGHQPLQESMELFRIPLPSPRSAGSEEGNGSYFARTPSQLSIVHPAALFIERRTQASWHRDEVVDSPQAMTPLTPLTPVAPADFDLESTPSASRPVPPAELRRRHSVRRAWRLLRRAIARWFAQGRTRLQRRAAARKQVAAAPVDASSFVPVAAAPVPVVRVSGPSALFVAPRAPPMPSPHVLLSPPFMQNALALPPRPLLQDVGQGRTRTTPPPLPSPNGASMRQRASTQ